MLGILIFPKEKNAFNNVCFSEALLKKIVFEKITCNFNPFISNVFSNETNRKNISKEIVHRMRNAVAHSHIEYKSDENTHKICKISFFDKYNNIENTRFTIKVEMLDEIIKTLLNAIKGNI